MIRQISGTRRSIGALLALFLLSLASAAFPAEPPSEPILRIDPGEHTSMIRRIATDGAGRWLVTASDDKTARVWDMRDGHLVTTLRIPIGSGNEGRVYAVALSPDGAIVAVAGWTQAGYEGAGNFNIYLFERATGRLLRRLPGLPNIITHLDFSSDGRWLAVTLVSQGVSVFAVASGQLLAEDRDYGGASAGTHFNSANGETRLVTTSFDGLLRLYRFDGSRLTLLAKRAAPGGKRPFDARFSPDGLRIAVGFDDTPAVNILDGDSLALRSAPDTTGVVGNFPNIAWSRDGKTLFAAGKAKKQFGGQWLWYIRGWDNGGAGAAKDWPVTGGTLMSIAALTEDRLAFSSGEPTWGVVDAEGQKPVFHGPVVADFRNIESGFALSPDSAQVRFGYEVFGKSPAIFDSLRRVFLPENTPNLAPPRRTASAMTVSGLIDTTTPKLNGTPLTLYPNERSISLALWPDGEGFVLGADLTLRAYARDGARRWQQVAPGAVWGVNVSQDGRWVVAAYGDGTIRWHRATDGVEQLAFYPHPDKKRWVMWSPSGYYDAAPGAEDLIGWHLNRGREQAADFFPASRFRAQFNRPDVLTKILETRDEAEALKLANAEAGRKAQVASIIQVLPPVVEIVSPSEGTGVSKPSLTLKYSARSPSDAPVTGIRVRVNGQAVTLPETRNLKVAETAGASGTREITLAIPPQDSEIQLFAESKNGVSSPAVLRVTWAGTKPAWQEEQQFKPKLYVLAVGVSKYANPDYNLGLAAKDATDLSAVLQKQKGKLYADVVVRLLTDGKATRDDVVDGLEWLKREVTARDVGVMFLAGHGMNDNTGKYFFMPHNADPAKLLRTGVAQNDIKDTLNSLAGKAVFFVDTCHSGNALGTARTRSMASTTDAFVNELASAENGVVVFSAATGRQLSQEDDAWGNGAFTKAVVEGLSGKADSQKTGRITHKALDYYVSERVKKLTNGEQSPVSIAPQGVTDFPIAVVQ